MAAIGVGVIGCGDIARTRYFPSIERTPGLALRGILSRRPSGCMELARRYGAQVHETLSSFLGDPAIEAVVIATPHPSHAELSLEALAAGKHVLCEKPMATTVADATRIRDAASRSQGVFMALPFDDAPQLIEARRLLRSGAIGTVSSADAVLVHRGPVHAPWFFDREKAGWGVLADLGVYLVSELTYLLGPAESVVGRVTTRVPERRAADGAPVRVSVDDNAVGIIAWPGGVLGAVRVNWCSPADHRNVTWEIKVYGTEGVLFISMGGGLSAPLVVYSPLRPIDGAKKMIHNGMSECYEPNVQAAGTDDFIMHAFVDSIAHWHGAERARHLARAHHVIEIIAKLYESSNRGTVVHLDEAAWE